MKLHCWDGVIGQHLKAESTSSVAASDPSGALITIFLTSLKVPQSHLKSLMLIWSLTDVKFGLFLGKDRTCTIRRSREPTVLGTVPKGDVLKGPIRNSSLIEKMGWNNDQRKARYGCGIEHGRDIIRLIYGWEAYKYMKEECGPPCWSQSAYQ